MSSLTKKLGSVPLEYQASVYAKHEKLKHARKQDEKRQNLQKLRDQLTVLKEQLRTTQSEALRAELKEKIATQEQAIKKAPRPKRRCTLTLSGSFENGKRR